MKVTPMNSPPTMLIVENNTHILADLVGTFRNLPPDVQANFGISTFQIDTARTSRNVTDRIALALRSARSYDVLLYDPGISSNEDPEFDDPEFGVDFLGTLDRRAFKAVAVETGLPFKEVLVRLMKTCLVDEFIEKPFDSENKVVISGVLRAYARGQERRWLEIRRERAEQHLLGQARADVAARMSGLVSEAISTVTRKTNDLYQSLEKYYQLNSRLDKDSPILTAIDEIRHASRKLTEDCAWARESISRDSDSWIFSVDQISNPASLVSRLRQSGDPLSRFLWGLFTDEGKRLLTDASLPSLQMSRVIVNELNDILHGDCIYDAQRFAEVKLSDFTLQQISFSLSRTRVLAINRRLLEEGYPTELAKAFTKQRVRLEDVLDEVADEMRPGFTSRRLQLIHTSHGNHYVHTFRNEIKMVVWEVLYGAVEGSSEGATLTSHVRREDFSITITIADKAPPIDGKIAEMIHNREPIDFCAGRGWGLALAHRTANSVGARLEINVAEDGNLVTLRIPLTKHDDIAYSREQSAGSAVLS